MKKKESLLYLGKAKITARRQVAERFFKMTINCPALAGSAQPGQFVSLKVDGSSDPLLRRPLGIHRVVRGGCELLYEVVGKGTFLLSRMDPGRCIDVMGPLGNGFDLSSASRSKDVILVAGGMGVAPLLFLAEKIKETRDSKGGLRKTALLGAGTKNSILCEKDFRAAGFKVEVATDDGSRGFKGKITCLLEKFLRTTLDTRHTTLYACGPRPMLRQVSRIARVNGIATQLSLEEHMACGIGACLGCVVQTVRGYKRVCKEGPVFRADEIIWDKGGRR